MNKLLATVPEALQLASDFPTLEEARQVMLMRLKGEVRKQEEALVALQDLLQDTDTSSATKANLTKHYDLVSRLHAKAKKQVDMAVNDFHELCIYFGYTSTAGNGQGGEVTIDPEVFFVEIKDLSRSLAETAQSVQSHKTRRKAIRS